MRRDHRLHAILLATFSALLFLDPPGSWLLDPDETRYAEIPREMLASGDFITPRLNGSHYFEKPPLLYWANAAAIALFGETPFAARLPVRLATLGVAALLARRVSGALTPGAAAWAPPGTGAWAALVYLSAALSFCLGRLNIVDGILSATLALALLCLREFLRRREAGAPAMLPLVLLGLSTGLSILAKGLIGVVIPGLVFLAWIAITGRWRRARELILSPAPIVMTAVAAPWFVLVQHANPGFARFFFVHEHLQRFATGEAARSGPVYYFVAAFLLGFLPWTLFLGRALASLWPLERENLRAHADELLLALWIVVIIAFFSISRSKLIPYVLPAFPAAALLAGRAIAASPPRTAGRAGFPAALAAAWAGVVLVLVAFMPRLASTFSGHDLADAARRSGAAQVVAYRCFLPSLPWILKRSVPVANEKGELGSDGDQPSDLFWTRDEFWSRWNSRERLAVLIKREDRGPFVQMSTEPPATVAENSRYMLLANFTPAPPGSGPVPPSMSQVGGPPHLASGR